MLPILMAAVLAAATVPPPFPIDVTRGEVDGLTALGFWPSERPDDQPTEPAGYVVHLCPVEDLDRELVYPAGDWIRPPRGRYVVWIDGKDRSSWTSNVVTVADSAFQGRGRAAVFPVKPAGTVKVVSSLAPSADLRVRLIHLESHNRVSEFPQEEFSRRVPLDAPAGSVTMPAGRAVAGIFSKEKDAYLALSRPFAIEEGKEANPVPAPPAAREADLMVLLERGEPARGFDDYEVAATLAGERFARPADVLIPTASRVYAIWYGVPSGPVRLSAAGSREFLPETPLELAPGQVGRRVLPLQRRPKVQVSLQIPEPLRREAGGLTLEVLREWRAAPILTRALGAGAAQNVLEGLPAEPLILALRAPPWIFHQEIDLRGGADQEVVFAPLGTLVSGQVRLGGEPGPAEIDFSTDLSEQKNHRVSTDGEGRYETWLWRQGTYLVHLRWPDRAEPYRQVIEIPEVAETLLDFDGPGARYRVRAVDRETRETVAIASAVISLAAKEGQSTSMELRGRDGQLELPPLPRGKLELTVRAEGYRDGKAAALEIDDRGRGETFTVELEPLGEIRTLALRRADGAPARGAEIRVQQELDAPDAIWSGRSGEDGRLELPADLGAAWILVRAADTGFFFAPLPPPSPTGEALEFVLPERTPPLAVQVVGAGGDPIGRAELAVAIGPEWLHGIPLAWLTGSRTTVADADGIYRLEGLPRAELELVASRAALPPSLEALAPLASRVAFPRPANLALLALSE